jgi:hypothetical protein
MQRSARSKLGYDSYPFLKDRWAVSSTNYPYWPPRRWAIDYTGATGLNWADVRFFKTTSDDGVVSADRETIDWHFQPITPDPLRTLSIRWYCPDPGNIFKALLCWIKLSYAHPLFLYTYKSFPFPGLYDKYPSVPVGGWLDAGNSTPPPFNNPDCPYAAHAVPWRHYPTPYPEQ